MKERKAGKTPLQFSADTNFFPPSLFHPESKGDVSTSLGNFVSNKICSQSASCRQSIVGRTTDRDDSQREQHLEHHSSRRSQRLQGMTNGEKEFNDCETDDVMMETLPHFFLPLMTS
jgi:hypothetical protein